VARCASAADTTPVTGDVNRLNISQFQKEFLAFEREERLFDLQYSGVPFWEYLRVAIDHELLLKKKLVSFLPCHRLPLRKKVGLLMKEIYHLFPCLLREFRSRSVACDIALFAAESKKATVALPFLRILSPDYRILVVDPSRLSGQKRLFASCDVFNWRWNTMISRFWSRCFIFGKDFRQQIRGVQKKLAASFNVSLPLEKFVRRIFLPQYFVYCRLEGFFRRFRPRLVGVINDSRMIGVIQAAHKAKIPVFELQHGMITPLEICWAYPEGLPKVPSGIPDFFLTFGDYWNARCELPSRKIAVGFPHFEEERERVFRKKVSRDPRAVLVISVMDQKLAAFLVELAKRLPDFTFYYKMRPEEFISWKEVYPEDFRRTANLIVVDSAEPSLYDLFRRVSYQIGSNSTALYEGLALGVKTILFAGFGYQQLLDLVETCQAWLVREPEEAVKILVQEGGSRDAPQEESVYFKSRSDFHLRKAIKELMSQDTCWSLAS